MPKLKLEIRLTAGGRDAATAVLFLAMAAVAIYGAGDRALDSLAALGLVGGIFALSSHARRGRK